MTRICVSDSKYLENLMKKMHQVNVCLATRRIDRISALATELAAKHNIQALAVETDVTNYASCQRAIASAVEAPIEGLTNGERFIKTVSALKTVGVKGDKLRALMRNFCVVMQLGNLTFDVDPNNDDGSIVSSSSEIDCLSDLIGIDKMDIEKAQNLGSAVVPHKYAQDMMKAHFYFGSQ